MENVEIIRYTDHPSGAQGLILYGGTEGPWSVVVDKKGRPHIWLRTKLEDGTPGYEEYAAGLPDDVSAPHELVDVVCDAPTEEMGDAWVEKGMAAHEAFKQKLIDDGSFNNTACLPSLTQGAC